jgi:hypothetical protein
MNSYIYVVLQLIIWSIIVNNYCPAMQNIGVHYETWNTGVNGPVKLHGLDEGSRDLTWQTWSYQVLHSIQ